MDEIINLVMLSSRIKNACEGFDGLNKNIPLDNKNLILLYLYKNNTAGNLELTSFLNFAKQLDHFLKSNDQLHCFPYVF